MLKDGSGVETFSPRKWDTKAGHEGYATRVGRNDFSFFGQTDLCSPGISGNLWTKPYSFGIPLDAPLLKLHDRPVLEVEVFWVRPMVAQQATTSPPPAKRAKTLPDIAEGISQAENDDNVRRFGVPIANALLEERLALRLAGSELVKATARVAATADAVAAVYGPHRSDGNQDVVIELNVRGTMMATLLSTLQACPESVLARQFDEKIWPVAERELDEHGRRLMDCIPSVFGRVLDVLRMQKYSARTHLNDGESERIRVALAPGDREPFCEFVDMYFVGNESFIMDFVELDGNVDIVP